jgi:hypothetical protein
MLTHFIYAPLPKPNSTIVLYYYSNDFPSVIIHALISVSIIKKKFLEHTDILSYGNDTIIIIHFFRAKYFFRLNLVLILDGKLNFNSFFKKLRDSENVSILIKRHCLRNRSYSKKSMFEFRPLVFFFLKAHIKLSFLANFQNFWKLLPCTT